MLEGTTRIRWGLLGALTGLFLFACHAGTPTAAPCPAGPAAKTDGSAPASKSAGAKPAARLAVEIEPRPDAPARILVTIAGATARRFVIADATSADLKDVKATDDGGDVPVAVGQASPGVSLELARPARGRLTLRYARLAEGLAPVPGADRVFVDENRAFASGERLLALPSEGADQPVDLELHIVTRSYYGPFDRAASSFGIENPVRVQASPNALAHATYLIGPMGHASLDSPDGLDRGAWLGYTAFDPRATVAEVAGFRSGVRQYLGELDVAPFTLLFLTDDRPAGDFDVTRRTTSVFARVGVNQVYNGALRVAVGQQALREWIGATLFVGDPREPGRSRWFTQGVSRYLARELCFRFGLLTPSEYLTEVEALERVALTSPFADKPDAELVKSTDPRAVALEAARGARHAADLDARLRTKSGGKRSLDSVLRELYVRAKTKRAALPESDWTGMLQAELGSDAVARFERGVRQGKVEPLPGDALGACFSPVPKRYDVFALGFELAPGTALPAEVRSVVPQSAAARAGLVAGDKVVHAHYRPDDASAKVVLELDRAGKAVHVEYLPVAGSVAGQGFRRLPAPKDEQCPRKEADGGKKSG